MNINANRIMGLKETANPIQFSFNKLKQKYTNVKALEYMCLVKSRPINELMENSKYIYSEPNYGASFFNTVLETYDFKTVVLEEQSNQISKYIKTLKDNKYKNQEHLQILENSLELIKSKIEYYLSDEYMKESFIHNQCLKVLSESKYDSDSIKEPDYSKLKTIAQIEGHIKYYKALKREEDGRGDHSYNHRVNIILNTLYEMVKALEKHKHIKEASLLEGEITNSNIDDIIFSVKSKIEEDPNTKEILDIFEDETDDLLIADDETDEDETDEDDMLELSEAFINFIIDGKPIEEITYDIDRFNKFASAYNKIYHIFEDVGTIRKITHKAKSAKKISDKIATKVEKTVDPINRGVSEFIDTFKKIDANERRNRIVEGKFRFKLLKIIRNAITAGGLAMIPAVGPALAAIAIISHVALDKKADKNIRRQLVNELKEELRMVEEKIDDSKSEGKKTEKYQLMRIKFKLANEIDRIEYHLDRS